MFFIVLAHPDNLVMDFRGSAPAGQHMFAAYPLNGLTHHGGRAQIHQSVAKIAYRRIGCNPGGSIAAATFYPQQQLTDGEFFFLLQPGFSRHFPCSPHGFFNGL